MQLRFVTTSTSQPWALVEDAIEEIQAKQLGKEQSKTLIASKMGRRQTRVRAASISLEYADKKDTPKVFPSCGQLDFSVKGLAEPVLLELKDCIESGSNRTLALSTSARRLKSVADLFAMMGEKLGRLDMLFGNAGVSGVGTLFENITFNHW